MTDKTESKPVAKAPDPLKAAKAELEALALKQQYIGTKEWIAAWRKYHELLTMARLQNR